MSREDKGTVRDERKSKRKKRHGGSGGGDGGGGGDKTKTTKYKTELSQLKSVLKKIGLFRPSRKAVIRKKRLLIRKAIARMLGMILVAAERKRSLRKEIDSWVGYSWWKKC